MIVHPDSALARNPQSAPLNKATQRILKKLPEVPASPAPSTIPSTKPDPAPGAKPPLPPSDDSGDDPSEDDSDAKLPKTDPNPLNPAGDMDTLVQLGINADLWQLLQGGLPCVEATTKCIAQLQAVAVQKNPLLKEVDSRIQDIQGKIDEAQKANKKSVNLSILRPATQVFLQPTNQQHHHSGVLGKLLSVFTGPVGIINELLSAVGTPLLDGFFGGNDQNQQRAISISDLQVKLAEIQRGRAELADKVKEKVALAVFDFDTSRRDFQIAQEISKRESSRMQLFEVEYRLGQGTSESYLGQLSSLDRNKAVTWKSWSLMRSQLEKIKLLVLGSPSESDN